MQLFPFVAIFALVCFVWSYGIQTRKRWAWCCGWVFGFFAAGAVCSLGMPLLSNTQSTLEVVFGCIFVIGGLCVWTFWAIWWATHRRMFSDKKPASSRR